MHSSPLGSPLFQVPMGALGEARNASTRLGSALLIGSLLRTAAGIAQRWRPMASAGSAAGIETYLV